MFLLLLCPQVLPSLMDKNSTPLLIQLLHMWAKYKAMTKCLRGFFTYLDRHYSNNFRNGTIELSLNDLSVQCFHDLVSISYQCSQICFSEFWLLILFRVHLSPKKEKEKTLSWMYWNIIKHGSDWFYFRSSKTSIKELGMLRLLWYVWGNTYFHFIVQFYSSCS